MSLGGRIKSILLLLRLDGSRGLGSFYIYKVPPSRIAAVNATKKLKFEIQAGQSMIKTGYLCCFFGLTENPTNSGVLPIMLGFNEREIYYDEMCI